MQYFNETRENGLFDYSILTIIKKCSLFPKDFIYSSLIIILRYIFKTFFKKIYCFIPKEYLLIMIQYFYYFNIIDITGQGFAAYLFLIFIYVEKLLIKMKLGTQLVITDFLINEISYNGKYLTNNYSTGNAVEFFLIQSIFLINTISLIGKKNNKILNYIIICLGILPFYIIIIHFNCLWNNFIQCLYLFFNTNTIHFLIYWSILLFCFIFINNSFQKLDLKKTVKRKIYHFLAFAILVPGIKYMEKDILKLILMIVSYFFIVFEFLRNSIFLKDNTFIKEINIFMDENIDDRDDNKFVVTHIFLMTGLISSLYYDNHNNFAFNYLSIIVLGIGDAMSSICGVYFGKTKIYPLTLRTLEGSIGGFSSSVFLYYLFKGSINKSELIQFLLVFLYEGYTLEIDNLFLPLISNNLFLNSDLINRNIMNLVK